jgi:hypothetical protein
LREFLCTDSKRYAMKKLTCWFVLGFGVCLIVLASAAPGQEPVVRSGNTEVVFKPADTSDLPMDQYKAFDEFANDHPDVVKMLSRNPRLADNPRFLKKHTELAMFFQQHPEIKTDFLANPGNYVAISR